MGAVSGAVSGTADGIRQAREAGENPWALRKSTVSEENHYSVYKGFARKTEDPKYVGMTGRKPEVRWNEHLHSETPRSKLFYKVFQRGLTKQEARIIEQQQINKYGLPNLYNQKNSIAPKYWEQNGIKP